VILSELCAHFGGCFYFTSRREGGSYGKGAPGSKGHSSYTVLARESDVAVIEYMFTYLSGEVDRLGRWHTGGEGVKVAIAWRMGCAMGIASQFRDMRASLRTQAQAEGRSCAMVLLSNREGEAKVELERQVGKLKKGAHISGGTDYNARAKGYTEGRKVSINKGLPQGGGNVPKLSQDGG
jgi:hypothetical protein